MDHANDPLLGIRQMLQVARPLPCTTMKERGIFGNSKSSTEGQVAGCCFDMPGTRVALHSRLSELFVYVHRVSVSCGVEYYLRRRLRAVAGMCFRSLFLACARE